MTDVDSVMARSLIRVSRLQTALPVGEARPPSSISPSWRSTDTPSSRPTSSVIRPFSTLRMVVPVNRIVLPV
ncbi:MAG: hypothetical protein ACRDRB_25885, partial [Pseudonocardiaceae bacterium]